MNDPRLPGNPMHPAGGGGIHSPTPPRPSIPGTPQPVLRPPQAGQPGIQPPRPAPLPPRSAPSDEPIALEEDTTELTPDVPRSAAVTPSKIKFGPDIGHKKKDYKRKPVVNGTGACRLKSFHAKYSDQGLEHLDEVVNDWLEEHPDIEVKFCTTTVHVFEGKIREPAIVMNVWY